jgi:23S rRNA (uracil1939-C5)-methyltransferase
VSKIKTFTAEVEKFDHQGRGIARIEGKTVFIDGALPNETVTARYTSSKTKYAQARTETVLTESPDRIAPRCQHHGICGGCSLQYLKPEAQIELKQAILAEHLQRTAKLQPLHWLAPITGPSWGYRRKARLGTKWLESKGFLIGFREKYEKRYLANIQQCEILDPRLGLHLDKLKACLSQLSCKSAIAQIEMAATDSQLALIIRHLSPLTHDDTAQLSAFAEQQSIHLYTQAKGLDSISLLSPAQGDPLLSYELTDFDIRLQFHPNDFTQVNADINQKMIALSLQNLAIQADDTVLDLFCGIGNFSLPLSTRAKHVTGIEYAPTMVQRAQANAELNHCHNVEFYAADLTQTTQADAWYKRQYDKILLDPPRTGALEILQNIKQFQAKKIVYISCNPATLARDTAVLVAQDYQLQSAGVLDMFPHTRHVEAVAVFNRDVNG